VKYALAKVFMGNWFYDRVANGVGFDEPMNYFGVINGYETLQMSMNTNTNGSWSYESIDIRIPNKTWKESVMQGRKYDYFLSARTGQAYTAQGIVEFNKQFESLLSQRDPFNTNKDLPCTNMGGVPCEPADDSYKCEKRPTLDSGKKYDKISDFQKEAPDNYYMGDCTLKTANIGSTETKTNVIWVDNKNGKPTCHIPWGGCANTDGTSTSRVCYDEELIYQTVSSPMGSAYCQNPTGGSPTFSSIWSNVPYGGVSTGEII
jgi:hypothetical protein